MKKFLSLFLINVIVLFFWAGCTEQVNPYDDGHTIFETAPGQWEVFLLSSSIYGNYHHFVGSGTYYINYLGHLNSQHYMISASPYFSVYYGKDKTCIIQTDTTSSWRIPISFTVPEQTDIYIEAGNDSGLYALLIQEETGYIPVASDAPLPQLSYNGTLSLDVSPSGSYASNRDIDFTVQPYGMIVFYSTDGNDPVIIRNSDLGDQYMIINEKSSTQVGNFITGFTCSPKFQGIYFDSETPVLSRNYEVAKLELSRIDAVNDFRMSKELILNSCFMYMGGGTKAVTVINFIEDGTFHIALEQYNSGTFTYQIDSGSRIAIPGTAAAFSVTTATTVTITSTQGAYYGTGTEFQIRMWM